MNQPSENTPSHNLINRIINLEIDVPAEYDDAARRKVLRPDVRSKLAEHIHLYRRLGKFLANNREADLKETADAMIDYEINELLELQGSTLSFLNSFETSSRPLRNNRDIQAVVRACNYAIAETAKTIQAFRQKKRELEAK